MTKAVTTIESLQKEIDELNRDNQILRDKLFFHSRNLDRYENENDGMQNMLKSIILTLMEDDEGFVYDIAKLIKESAELVDKDELDEEIAFRDDIDVEDELNEIKGDVESLDDDVDDMDGRITDIRLAANNLTERLEDLENKDYKSGDHIREVVIQTLKELVCTST